MARTLVVTIFEMSNRVERAARMNRRKQMSLEIVSAVETQQLENSVASNTILDILWPYLPIIAWYKCFYAPFIFLYSRHLPGQRGCYSEQYFLFTTIVVIGQRHYI